MSTDGIDVEFVFESGETRTRRMPAVPRRGDLLLWMSTDEYPDKPAGTMWDTETMFRVDLVQWTIIEPDGGEPGGTVAPVLVPEASVRVGLVRQEPSEAGVTPAWMKLDDHDRRTAERQRAIRQAHRGGAEANAGPDDLPRYPESVERGPDAKITEYALDLRVLGRVEDAESVEASAAYLREYGRGSQDEGSFLETLQAVGDHYATIAGLVPDDDEHRDGVTVLRFLAHCAGVLVTALTPVEQQE